MKISKEQEMGQAMKKSHDKISNFTPKASTLEDKMNVHRRKMDNVQRLSGFKLFQDYSLTKHCFHTGLLFISIASKEGIDISLETIDFVFNHDILETVTGDLLYTVKNYNKRTQNYWDAIELELTCTGAEFEHLRMYTDEYFEKHTDPKAVELFKACDLLELWEFCRTEYYLGNKSVSQVINNCRSILSNCGIESIEDRVDSEWK